LVTTSAGIHCRITSAIRIRAITVITIGRRQTMVAATLVVLAGRTVGAMVIRPAAVLVSNPALVLVSLVAGLISPVVGLVNRRELLTTRRGAV
jgi:hypothetical protein